MGGWGGGGVGGWGGGRVGGWVGALVPDSSAAGVHHRGRFVMLDAVLADDALKEVDGGAFKIVERNHSAQVTL